MKHRVDIILYVLART